jgi:xanthine dehydrogenase accessory factor
VRRPASARRGDRGLVTADGTLVGWVGGACSEPIVIREALRAVAEGSPRLVRIGPPGTHAGPGEEIICAESHCASEGVVEVLIEPQRPGPLLAVVGNGPGARTLAELARTIGWRVTADATAGAEAVVVATMGTRGRRGARRRARALHGLRRTRRSARRAGVVLARLRSAACRRSSSHACAVQPGSTRPVHARGDRGRGARGARCVAAARAPRRRRRRR